MKKEKTKKKDWLLILSNDKNRAIALSLIKELEQKNIYYKETTEGIEIKKRDLKKLKQNHLTTKTKSNEL